MYLGCDLCTGKLHGYVDQIAGVLTMNGSGSGREASTGHGTRQEAAVEGYAAALSAAVDGFEIKFGNNSSGGSSSNSHAMNYY